jgi:hypothetical protein
MPKTPRMLPDDEIADKASRGEDISSHLTNEFTVVRPLRRVNVVLTQGMLRDLDARRATLRKPPGGDQDLAGADTGRPGPRRKKAG